MKKVDRNYTAGKSNTDLIGCIGFCEPVEVDTTSTKKVLITGAGSYIGETFRTYAAVHYPELEIDAVDMIDGSWSEKDFSVYDVIYHVAGIAHADVGNVDEATKEKYYVINTDLAVEVCKKAKSEGVKEFVFMSSMIVYGDSAPHGEKKIVDEHTVPKAANFYGDSKLQADVAVRDMADDSFKVIVLRPPMIYGKGSKGNYAMLAKFAKILPVFPDVDNDRSMLHIDNLCEFLCQIMLVKEFKENSVVLMPQNDEWTRTSEMVKEIAEISGKKIRMIGGIMKPVVSLGGKIPGKINGLVNKVFGNSCYAFEMSQYEGINYQTTSLKESIVKTEVCNSKESVTTKVGCDGLVSVIMPAYNAEMFVDESICSVLNQKYKNWELIIVDDCSSDNTVSVVQKYVEEDSRIHLYCQKVNSGSAAARNKGISKANGRYIAFLDADDLWFTDKLQKQISFMKENDYDFTFTSYELFSSEDGKSRGVFNVPSLIYYEEYLKNTIIGNLTVILDRWKVDNVHVEIGDIEDVLTWMYFLKRGYTAYGLNLNLAKYRVYVTSKSGNKLKNAKKYYECLRKNQGLSVEKSILCEICYLFNASVKRIKGRIQTR